MAGDATPELAVDRRWQDRRREPGEIDRRVARSRDRALTAARTVLFEEGWDALTQQRVAEASGVGRATVYRLWPERSEILHDLCVQEMRTMSIEPVGDLRSDLCAELAAMRSELIDRHFDRVLVTVTDRSPFDSALRAVKLALIAQGTERMRRILAGAVDSNELAPLNLDEAVATLVGPMLYRHVFADEPVTEKDLQRTVDDFLILRRFRTTVS